MQDSEDMCMCHAKMLCIIMSVKYNVYTCNFVLMLPVTYGYLFV